MAPFGVANPSDATVITEISDADVEDGLAAVDAASGTLPAWSATPSRQRADVLRRCFDLMTERSEQLAYLISMENGKSLAAARREVAYASEFLRWHSEEAVLIIGDVRSQSNPRAAPAHRRLCSHHAEEFSSRNDHAQTGSGAGSRLPAASAVLKPATLSPLTSLASAQLTIDAGVPVVVINVITTTKTSEVMTSVLADSRVRKLSFTESTTVGRHLLRQAANRIYVQRGIHDKFARRLAEKMRELRVGAGTEPTTQVGPLVDAASVQKVDTLGQDAVAHGAEVLVGGAPIE